ncbi:VanZ family protein [Methylacidiphilum caldifontis]|uniref:Teicoplanin resistance protein VanZ n=1 Tax=Methylacidiphilum caldifontis TaxID=2795386 RepID=A0A4Y8PGY8_9BACT|nr:VanZ family protein [Methylacidiphilum caldifontis]QSR88788.1 VanZ family protein [Methylacidiphilum caldifontis]TFE71555.1 teicoplanin resistance protein VanZ [Methylacidiphilum caldifontis]
MQKKIGRWVVCFLYGDLLITLSSFPGQVLAQVTLSISDKILHATAYAGLGFLFSWASTRFILGIVLSSLFGALDENYQRLVPGRECDLYDWFADCFGAIIGTSLYFGLARFFSTQKKMPQEDLNSKAADGG